MVKIRVNTGSDIIQVHQALADTVEEPLTDGLIAGYIDITTEQMIIFLMQVASEQGIKNLKLSASFPAYPKGKDQKIDTSLLLPSITITPRIGLTEEIGIGRGLRNTVDGMLYGFKQYMIIEFDCHGTSVLEADRMASWVSTTIQRYKLDRLRHQGFQNFRNLYSRAVMGIDPTMAWDYVWRFYSFRVFRHLIYVETSFEVTWLQEPDTSGLITQIIFNSESSFSLDLVIGNSMEYMLAEEINYNWFDLFF